jgi:DHA1 family tetracycline resistance protein-like MFS transporter
MALVWLFFPETLRKFSTAALDIRKPFHNIKEAFSRPGLRSVMPSSFLFTAGFTFFTTFFGVILTTEFGFSPSNTGDYFAYIGLWIAIVQGGITGQVAKHYKDYQVIRVSMFISALALLGYSLVPAGEYRWLFLIPPFMALGNGLTMAFNTALVSRISPRQLQGEVLGINASVMALAQSIPAILVGYVASFDKGLVLVVASGLIGLAGIVFWILFEPKQFEPKNSQ